MDNKNIIDNNSSGVVDIDESQFMSKVIEESKSLPVLVDFWAPWCEPCKQLGPSLEEEVRKTNGKIKLVKINIDDNQGIAQQLRVQSIPMVYAFVDGRPVDGFAGALSKDEISSFVEKIANSSSQAQNILNDARTALDAAEENFRNGNVNDSINEFSKILEMDLPKEEVARAISGLGKCYISLGKPEDAENLIDGVDSEILKSSHIESLQTSLKLLGSSKSSSQQDEYIIYDELKNDPNNKDLKYKLAEFLISKGENEKAIEQLIEIIVIDRKWNDEIARKKLLDVFKALGDNDPLTIDARSRLSKILFA